MAHRRQAREIDVQERKMEFINYRTSSQPATQQSTYTLAHSRNCTVQSGIWATVMELIMDSPLMPTIDRLRSLQPIYRALKQFLWTAPTGTLLQLNSRHTISVSRTMG